jgi:hypothetical protein
VHVETSFYKGLIGSGVLTVKLIRYMSLTLGQEVRHAEGIQEAVCIGTEDGVMRLILLFDPGRW